MLFLVFLILIVLLQFMILKYYFIYSKFWYKIRYISPEEKEFNEKLFRAYRIGCEIRNHFENMGSVGCYIGKVKGNKIKYKRKEE